ncbi:MAG: T9SS type A sorting domain-containing protein [Bacteroidales bacterium]|nr:T9SS type A sorting domain-containing protein [Bacteroidales bacterium]
MKKIIRFFALIVLIFTALSINAQQLKLNNASENDLQLVSKSQTGFQVISTLSEMNYLVVKTEKGNFLQLQIPGYTKNYAIGSPELPMLKHLIEIPHEAQITINVLSYDEEIIDLNALATPFKMFPVQPSISKSADPSEIVFQYDEQAYLNDAFNKRPMAEVKVLGFSRGVQLGRLEIAPFRYNPVTNQLKVYNNIEIQVVFENADFSKTVSQKNQYFSPAFESTFSKLLNYQPVKSKDEITSYPIKYVIVSDPMFETILQPFIEWKTKKGFTVIEAYTDDAAVGSTTTSIKAYLQGLYTAGTPTDPAPSFILFVGDQAQVPAFSGTAGSHISDLYYCTYDGAGDIYPEVYYGRFSATNTNQLQPQIDKTLEYEQYLFPSDAFLNDVVLVSGVDGSMAPTHGNGQINYGTQYYFNAAHGITDYTWLYPASDATGVDATIRAQVSEGCSFVNYTAHCSSDGWADPSFSVANVASMTNAHEYPLSIGNCCLSNEFDVAVCFGEALLRAENKGALGHIGGSNSTYWNEDFWWGVGSMPSGSITANPTYAGSGLGAYDCLFHDNGEDYADWFVTNSQVMYAGNMAVTEAGGSETYYWEIYHLMGDPSVMTYISVPPAMTVNYMNPVPVGTISLEVTAEPYAYVALSVDGVLYDAKYTGSNSVVTLEFSALLNPGAADIVVTKQFRQPFISTLDIVSGNTENDAQLSQINIPLTNHSIMAAEVNPTFTIRNLGNTNLTAAQVGYEIDGGTITSQPWTGNLAQYETEQVVFPLITLPSGTHTITAFVSWPNGVEDEFHPGDTTSKVFNVTAGDAAVTAINDFEDVYCNAESFIPSITISNKGTVDLTSVDVNYQINSGTVQTINWTGTLIPNATAVVEFPSDNLVVGNMVFTAYTSNPNGGSDENTSNDEKSETFSVFADAETIVLALTTDDYAEETSWEITDDVSGTVLYSGGGYSNWSSQTYNYDFCFGEGCYTLTIYDSYGDGMDGYVNDGSFTISNTTISEVYGTGGGNFGYETSVNFCVGEVSVEENHSNLVRVFPNPSTGLVFVNSPKNSVIEVINILGETVFSINSNNETTEIDLSNQTPGIYNIQISTGLSKITEKIVIAN